MGLNHKPVLCVDISVPENTKGHKIILVTILVMDMRMYMLPVKFLRGEKRTKTEE